MSLAQIEIVANQIEAQRFGYMAISLTEYDTDNEPQIAAGSKVEIGGALFSAAALESITGWGSIGNNNDAYIKLVVSGTTATAEFTTAAPTWSTSKQGWYGTGGAALHRYVAKLRKDGSGNYTEKCLYQGGPEIRAGMIGDGEIITAKIAASAVVDAKIDKTLDAGGSQAFTLASDIWVPPAGLYVMTKTSTGTRSAYVEIYQGGAWRGTPVGLSEGFTLLCDGANVRLHGDGGSGTGYVWYLKLA